MNLEYLRPEAHPLRAFFRQNGVTYAMLARYCGCSIGWIGQLLAGYRPMPGHIAGKLADLADRIRREGVNA